MVAVLILAAGRGTRMVSDTPKILHSLGGKPMVHYVIDAAREVSSSPMDSVVVVLSPTLDATAVQGNYTLKTVIQPHALGTGDAVKIGLEALSESAQDVLILCGDTPLLEASFLSKVLKQHQDRSSPCITVVGMHSAIPNSYGRIVTDAKGKIDRIVEYRDASETERAITLCNSGVIVANQNLLRHLIAQLTPQNEAGEYYLTDIVGLASQEGMDAWCVELPAEPLQGINTRVDLAAAEKTLQNRWRHRFMQQGVTLIDPTSVFFSHDTQIGYDVTIHPNVTFGPGVTMGNHAKILPNCHLENASLGHHVSIGPFAHLRDEVVLQDHVAIGNFVEIKGSTIGAHTKAKHLAYLGNAHVGENVNIGAGTITCNHNGFVKSQTSIGKGAYVGSNSCLVAPLKIGEGAIVAAGSVVVSDVPDHALAIAREHQQNKPSWAIDFRNRYKKEV